MSLAVPLQTNLPPGFGRVEVTPPLPAEWVGFPGSALTTRLFDERSGPACAPLMGRARLDP
jgi:hypothetical protein